MGQEDLRKSNLLELPEEYFESIPIPYGSLFAEKVPNKKEVLTLVYMPKVHGNQYLFTLSSIEGGEIVRVDWKGMGIPLVCQMGGLINRNPEGSKNLWSHNTYWIEKGFGPVVLSYMTEHFNFAGDSLRDIHWRKVREAKGF